MIQISTFYEIYFILKDANIVTSLKQLATKTGYNYTYLSELKNNKKPLTESFVRTINEKLNQDFTLNEVDYVAEYDRILNKENVTLKKYTSNIKVLEKDIRLVPLINRYAYASYSESWNDNEFLESMELLPTFHQEDGNYLWFEIKGDSMTRNDDPSLNEGDYVLGRELYNHHWMNLQLRRAKVWVINHRIQGLMVKEVVKQKDNVITCHSWNPIVPPFDLDLNEVNQLFYIKEVRKTNFF